MPEDNDNLLFETEPAITKSELSWFKFGLFVGAITGFFFGLILTALYNNFVPIGWVQ